MPITGQNTELWTGDDVRIPFLIETEDGAPDNLSLYTAFSYVVKEKPGGTALITRTLAGGAVVVDNAAQGSLHVTLLSTDTATMGVIGEHQDFVHELEGTRSGLIKTLMTGRFRLHKSVANVGA